MASRLVAALGIVVFLASCAASPTDSGIAGMVTIGPTRPVATAGSPNTKPFSAELLIAPKAGLHLKRPVTAKSAEDGTFKVDLAPGDYVISAIGSGSPPTLSPVEVAVQPHQFAKVELRFDSGIR